MSQNDPIYSTKSDAVGNTMANGFQPDDRSSLTSEFFWRERAQILVSLIRHRLRLQNGKALSGTAHYYCTEDLIELKHFIFEMFDAKPRYTHIFKPLSLQAIASGLWQGSPIDGLFRWRLSSTDLSSISLSPPDMVKFAIVFNEFLIASTPGLSRWSNTELRQQDAKPRTLSLEARARGRGLEVRIAAGETSDGLDLMGDWDRYRMIRRLGAHLDTLILIAPSEPSSVRMMLLTNGKVRLPPNGVSVNALCQERRHDRDQHRETA